MLRRMTDTMRPRGPDDAGIWAGPDAALGHRRLAVIDVEGGAQPMLAARGPDSGPVVLVYGGEVYNFGELRRQLCSHGHRFRTRSDTEVVLRSYLQWGERCVERFNGMFAFAVWDADHRSLLLARDRMGIKPLYYAPLPSGVLFASEPKGLFAHGAFAPQVGEEALPLLLNARLALPGETPVHGMHEVAPGHVLVIGPETTRERRYWALTSREHRDNLPTTIGRVRELLEDVVARQVVADVPVSCLLSGGLDSATVSALAVRELPGRLRTYCVDFADDERHFRPTALRPERDAPYARVAAEHLGTDHSEVVLAAKDVTAAVPATRRARDLPGFGQFDSSIYLLFKAVRLDSTVTLSAEAADELFGGYPWFHDPATVWRDTFPWLGDAPRLAGCLAGDVRERVRPDQVEADRYATLLARVPRLPGETGLDARMREVLFLSLSGPLAVLLDRKDRMSMAVGLEARVPFCDHRLVEYVWNVPWSVKTAGGHQKSLLR
ncbi:MAG TPA: asparagine synthase (glutamine-hydrolyzing), partial [Pseudonocardiaceae bacterium]|nr:asparagine synthase (glutamine-hydrolyzing) [Pseudonocardiaceae bacterium]